MLSHSVLKLQKEAKVDLRRKIRMLLLSYPQCLFLSLLILMLLSFKLAAIWLCLRKFLHTFTTVWGLLVCFLLPLKDNRVHLFVIMRLTFFSNLVLHAVPELLENILTELAGGKRIKNGREIFTYPTCLFSPSFFFVLLLFKRVFHKSKVAWSRHDL